MMLFEELLCFPMRVRLIIFHFVVLTGKLHLLLIFGIVHVSVNRDKLGTFQQNVKRMWICVNSRKRLVFVSCIVVNALLGAQRIENGE